MHQYTLAEYFTQLALHPEKGELQIDASYYRYGLAAAIVAELLYEKMLKTGEKKYFLEGRKKTLLLNSEQSPDHEILAIAFEKIKAEKKERSIREWYEKLATGKPDLKKLTMEELARRNTIKIEKDRIWGIFPRTRYFLQETTERNKVKDKLLKVVLKDEQPTEKELVLLGLARQTDLFKKWLPKDVNRKQAMRKLKDLTSKEKLSELLGEHMQELAAALIVSTVVVTTVATSAGD